MATSRDEPAPGLVDSGRPASHRETWSLGLFFGAIYFLQGLGEPTEGLIAQPVNSLLTSWGRGAAEIATFSALLSIPWALKPLYGLISDFLPLGGSRRRSYLIVTSVVSAVSLLGLAAFPVARGDSQRLLAWLVLPTVAVAFADVVADALMVERGQPLRLTGRLQAIQWACLYSASIVNGLVGGFLCEHHHEGRAFLLCGGGAVLTLLLAIGCVREPVRPASRPRGREALRVLARSARSPLVLGVGGFLFLWSFNPFSTTVLYVYMTRELGFSKQFYGETVALMALASIAASLGYGVYCRRVPRPVLAHASIALGVASTLAYLGMTDERSAVVVTLAVGFTYMTALLIQLDLAAQICPPETAGTVFALLMALSNLGTMLSTWLGGTWYEQGLAHWGSRTAFEFLVVTGAAFTAACWLLVPFLPRGLFRPGEPAR